MKKDIKSKALRRLKIIRGQIGGLEKMVEEEKYCIDIIVQTEAVREALSAVRNLILENHLSTHLAHQMKHGEESTAVAEMMKVYKLIGKK
jgi:CsoR family transcriptional regulator, copper-sensing transcriptional repressor